MNPDRFDMMNEDELRRELRVSRAALIKAKETIHDLHGDVAWEIYDKHSPEMKQINAALGNP